MKTIELQEFSNHLDAFVMAAAVGEEFVVAKPGKPLIRVQPAEQPVIKKRTLGFMQGQIEVPDDFNEMYQAEIEAMFYGDE